MTTERTEKRVNRFNGESVMLTKEEAKIHDEIFIHEVEATLEDYELGQGVSKHWQKMRDKISWFMKHNAKAYMVLLDYLSVNSGPGPEGSRSILTIEKK